MSHALRFLVVDDFATMRRLMKSNLHDLGYTEINEADDGRSALTILKQGNTDFLVTDWNMPGMSGLELLQAMRADPQLKKVPVLLVTAEAKRDQIIEAARAGVDGYVVKPFTSETLKAKIEKILTAGSA
jgi:two-component system chemotaxis response regulator CheY